MPMQEFNFIRDKARWIFVGPDRNGNQPTRTDSRNNNFEYHGTAMLSLVAGSTLGVAKKVTPMVVRLPGALFIRNEQGVEDFAGSFTPEDWLSALGMVNDELRGRTGASASCVVLMAQYYPRAIVDDAWVRRVWEVLSEMERRGAILVRGQGEQFSLPYG